MKGTFDTITPPFMLRYGVGGGVLIVLLLLSSMITFAAIGQLDDFKDNITMESFVYNNYTINFPKYAYLTNVSINLTSFNSTGHVYIQHPDAYYITGNWSYFLDIGIPTGNITTIDGDFTSYGTAEGGGNLERYW